MYDITVKFLGGLDNLGGKAGNSLATLSDEHPETEKNQATAETKSQFESIKAKL